MKRLALGLMAATLMLNIVPLDGTLSFLTSEKKQVSPVSTGTNEDVFVADTTQILLKTKVEKRTKVRRVKNADGSSSERKENKLSVMAGSRLITFAPQRPDLDLDVENIAVTGDAAGEITVERIDDEGGKNIVFRISHRYQSAWDKRSSGTDRGEVRVTALGGFYSLTIPLTISTSYKESTDVTEEAAPNQPGQPSTPSTPSIPDTTGNPGTPDTTGTSDTPGTPDTPSTPDTPNNPGTPPDTSDPSVNTPVPGGDEAGSAQPPSTGSETVSSPSTDPSGPAPPSPEDAGSNSTVPNTPSDSPSIQTGL